MHAPRLSAIDWIGDFLEEPIKLPKYCPYTYVLRTYRDHLSFVALTYPKPQILKPESCARLVQAERGSTVQTGIILGLSGLLYKFYTWRGFLNPRNGYVQSVP